MSLEDIKKVVDGITRCYVLGDYTTSRAYLPPQTIEDGILKIGLIEGTVGKVTVEDNVHTRTTYITSRVPIQEGSVVQLGKLQKDVIKFNNLNTAKLKIELYAGENQGETDIVLKTEEPFPFKVSVMTDNAGRESTGKNRVGAMVTYDSVLGLRDKLTLGGYLGKGTRIGFADYNIPISKYGTRFGVSVSANNIDVVKRLTGGRALLHDNEITYSCIFPVSYLQNGENVTKSYMEISQFLINMFASTGIELDFGTTKPVNTKHDYCMLISTGADLCYRGKKLIGSAQCRKNGYILQHGSILYDFNRDLLEKIFKEPINESSVTCVRLINPELSREKLVELLTNYITNY